MPLLWKETHELKARMDGVDGRFLHMLAAANSNARVERVLKDNVSILKQAVRDIENSVRDLDNAVVVSESCASASTVSNRSGRIVWTWTFSTAWS